MSLVNLAAGFDISSLCSSEVLDIVQLVGYLILIVKVAIPLLIVALGIFDFGKAVVAEKEDEIKKQTKRLLYRVIAGVVIFFIPSLVVWIFTTFVDDYSTEAEGFQKCSECFLHPSQCN